MGTQHCQRLLGRPKFQNLWLKQNKNARKHRKIQLYSTRDKKQSFIQRTLWFVWSNQRCFQLHWNRCFTIRKSIGWSYLIERRTWEEILNGNLKVRERIPILACRRWKKKLTKKRVLWKNWKGTGGKIKFVKTIG